MQSINQDIEIIKQRKKVFEDFKPVQLHSSCVIGNGILSVLNLQKENLIKKFDLSNDRITFFIPASGSGSRMFQFLYEFLEYPNDDNRSKVEKFLGHIKDFAFYDKLPFYIRESLENYNINLEEFVTYLLSEEGLNFSRLPKGMVPFHKIGPFVLTPFQEQLLQGKLIKNNNVYFHYTLNPDFESFVKRQIEKLIQFTSKEFDISFSYQDPTSNAIAFDNNENELFDLNGDLLTRPAGHGALLQNLNQIDSDFIFLKNIDNLQHYLKADNSVQTWKFLGGMALWFKEEVSKVLENPTLEQFYELNKIFSILHPDEINKLTEDDITNVLNRPFRICGMVRNEGQPGGGPFWINRDGKISKQIVEKSQISLKGNQNMILVQSTHFNPVMIVAHTKDMNGNKFDLTEFKDDEQFFVVKKSFKGKDIQFAELPGLWNGSMAEWNTVFVEIPSDTFSPVKTVLDLLEYPHMP